MFGIRDQFFRVRSKTDSAKFIDFEAEELARDYIAKEDVSAEDFELCCFTKNSPKVKFSPFDVKGVIQGAVIEGDGDPGFKAVVAVVTNPK